MLISKTATDLGKQGQSLEVEKITSSSLGIWTDSMVLLKFLRDKRNVASIAMSSIRYGSSLGISSDRNRYVADPYSIITGRNSIEASDASSLSGVDPT